MSKFEQMSEMETLEDSPENNEELQNVTQESPVIPILDEALVQKEALETQERIDTLRQEIGQEQNESILENPSLETPMEKELDPITEEENLIGAKIFENISSLGSPLLKSPEKKPKKKKNSFVKFLAKAFLPKDEYKIFIGSYEKGQGVVDKAENLITQKRSAGRE